MLTPSIFQTPPCVSSTLKESRQEQRAKADLPEELLCTTHSSWLIRCANLYNHRIDSVSTYLYCPSFTVGEIVGQSGNGPAHSQPAAEWSSCRPSAQSLGSFSQRQESEGSGCESLCGGQPADKPQAMLELNPNPRPSIITNPKTASLTSFCGLRALTVQPLQPSGDSCQLCLPGGC